MNFIKTHKVVIIILMICIGLLTAAGISFYKLMFPTSAEDINGDRMEGASEVDQAIIEQILGELNASELVNSATYEKNIRIIKFFIDTTSGTELESAKKLTDIIISKLNEDVITSYDIHVYLTQEDNENYPAIGTHFKYNDYFSWVNNGVEEDE